MKIFGKEIIDQRTVNQGENCLIEDSIGVLTGDAHYGYSQPVGMAIAYKNHISVSGVGFDIGCGNKAVKTNVKIEDIGNISRVMDEIFSRVSFGTGRVNNEPIDHPVLDKIAHADFAPQRKLWGLAAAQLGTVGSGNHYIDLFTDAQGWVWIGVHFGSRGFGHKTATGFIAMSQGLSFEDKGKEGSMDSKPILLSIDNSDSFDLGHAYIEAMSLAGEYAYAGRDVVVNKVLEILGAKSVYDVHNHHNFAFKEQHFGQWYWAVRKGCTPAFPNQAGFIGSNMMDYSVIVEGIDSEESKQGLYSTVHGAGRIMSRTEAAGKSKWKNGEKIKISEGKINFDEVKEKMKGKGVELRGAGADEAPEAYKKLVDVLDYHKGTIEIKHILMPIGVCMAGSEIKDPYKD